MRFVFTLAFCLSWISVASAAQSNSCKQPARMHDGIFRKDLPDCLRTMHEVLQTKVISFTD